MSTLIAKATTWAAAYPYIQTTEGQDVKIKAASYSPYDGLTTFGYTRVYYKNKLLYQIDEYYRGKMQVSDDGKYLAIIKTNNTTGLTSYTMFGNRKIDYNNTAIKIFKNGKPYKSIPLKAVIDTNTLANNGWIYNWGYIHNKDAFREAIHNCEACLEIYGKRTLKRCDTNEIYLSECIECNSSCDSMQLEKVYKRIQEHSVYVMQNTLHILTNQGTVVLLNFEDLSIDIKKIDTSTFIKKNCLPPKTKRKHLNTKLPDKFVDLPLLTNNKSLEETLRKFHNISTSDTLLKAYLTILINRKGGVTKVLGRISYNKEVLFNSYDKKITKKGKKIINWILAQRFKSQIIPKRCEQYAFRYSIY